LRRSTAARVAQIAALVLDDVDLGNRRLTIAATRRSLTYGPDPLHPAEVFGLDEKTAMR
jgi:hypothetical protein